MRNPFRDEGAAFRLVFLTIGAFALIAIGSAISTWLGVVAAVGVATVGAGAVWTGRRERPDRRQPRPADRARILVVANETVEGRELLDEIRTKAAARAAEVYVVSPALNSKLRHWTSDEDAAREAAQARLDRSLDRLRSIGVFAAGEVGDADPVQAVEDALAAFGADEIVLSTHPEGRSHWLEQGVVQAVRERFVVPVTHIVVDLERQQAG